MTDAEQAELQEYRRQDLLRHMKGVSEDHWSSGWKRDLEHDLYLMTFHDLVADYGMAIIEPARLARMKRLAQLTESWWTYSEEQKQPITIPLAEAERRFSKLIARDDDGATHTLSIAEVKQLYAAASADAWERETVSSPLTGMPGWQLYRLRTNPLLVVMRQDDAQARDDWELRFGETTLELVRPTWADKR
ncbi:MAG: hypothetical protein ABW321_26545 [Polyangiales bacterium]